MVPTRKLFNSPIKFIKDNVKFALKSPNQPFTLDNSIARSHDKYMHA